MNIQIYNYTHTHTHTQTHTHTHTHAHTHTLMGPYHGFGSCHKIFHNVEYLY